MPAGMHTLTPRMVVSDLAGTVEFLRAALGGSGAAPAGRPAEIRIGDSLVMVSQAGERDVFPAFLYVYVADADATYRRALLAGAETLEAPLDTPYGDRRAMVRDRAGNVFQIAHRLAAAGPGAYSGRAGYVGGMADTSEAAAELRLSRIKAMGERDLVSLLTYLLARYPDSFPDLLDDALSTISPDSARTAGTADA
jgi:PhnB protein